MVRRFPAKIAAVLMAAGGLALAAGGLAAAAAALALAAAAPAAAQIAFAPCEGSNEFACGHLTVPLDPTGAQPGTITLAMRRHRAPVGEEKSAVIALAGGPGQAALPFAEQFASLLGPIVATRDLIVFDQRGTGLSHPLSCQRFQTSALSSLPGKATAECAVQLGPTRSLYTTADSVADIEAIRRAGGYEKLVLYGTSYGTKLAEEYARAYPSRVEALVLDSVVPPNGPDPLNRASFTAVGRILRQLCTRAACEHVTSDPGRDLAVLIRRLGRGRRARWIDGRGHGHAITISAGAVLEALFQGDLEPTLRAEFPAAVHAAARGDLAEFARLLERSRSGEREAERPSEGFDTALYFATTCEEAPFPWNRAAPPSRRLAEAEVQIRALGTRVFSPFSQADVLGLSDIPSCAFWPYTTPAPAAQDAPFPSVPTLILSGADDMRTPTASAVEVAAQIPHSKLLVVPNVGHSVLGSDPSSCSHNALLALFAGTPIKPCPSGPAPALLRPTPLPPAGLGDVAPAKGNHGRPGRTLDAVLLTISDFEYHLAVQALAQLEEQIAVSSPLSSALSVRVGGLRSGWGELAANKLTLHRYSYVPGVSVSGEISGERIALAVAGPAAAPGTLRAELGSSGAQPTLAGQLEGQTVRVAGVASSRAGARAALSGLRSMSAVRNLAPTARSRLLAAAARLRGLIGISP